MKLQQKSWITLLRLYIPLFIALCWLYFRMKPGMMFRGQVLKGNMGDYKLIYAVFAVFFGGIFLGFLIRDFRRLILPFLKDGKNGQKRRLYFPARKYSDPFYDKRLLFYPEKEDYYIEVDPEDFDAIANGQRLLLEVACITGEVLLLKSQERVFQKAEEFSFKDM